MLASLYFDLLGRENCPDIITLSQSNRYRIKSGFPNTIIPQSISKNSNIIKKLINKLLFKQRAKLKWKNITKTLLIIVLKVFFFRSKQQFC